MIKKVIRIVNWAILVLTAVSLVLVFVKPRFASLEPTPQATQSFDEKLKELAEAHQKGTPLEVQINEAELNSKVQDSLKGAPLPSNGPATLKSFTINLDGKKLLAVFMLKVGGLNLYLTLGGELSVRNRRVEFTPTDLKLGRLPVPAGAVESVLRDRMKSLGLEESLGLPDEIKDVRIENGELILVGQ